MTERFGGDESADEEEGKKKTIFLTTLGQKYSNSGGAGEVN